MTRVNTLLGNRGAVNVARDARNKPNLAVTDLERETKTGGTSNIAALYAVGGALDTFSIVVGSMSKASAIRARGKFEEASFIENSRRLKLAAADALKRGDKDAVNFMKSIRKFEGSQTAALAAQNIDISRGTAKDIREETINLGLEDMSTIRTNALRESLGLKEQAIEQRLKAQTTRIARKQREKTTLLTGRLRVASSIAQTGISINRAGSA